MDAQLVQHHLLKDCLLLIGASLCWLYLCGSLPGIYILFSWSQCSLVAQSCLTLCDHGQQHARPPCPSPTPGVYSNSSPLSWWCHQPSHPLSPPSPATLNISQHQGLFQWVSSSQSIEDSALASVLPMNIQGWFLLGWTGGSPFSPRDFQESSPTPQFKRINSSVLRFLYCLIHTWLLEKP